MFGHQDDHDDTSAPPASDDQAEVNQGAVNTEAAAPDHPADEPAAPPADGDATIAADPNQAPATTPAPDLSDPDWQHPGKPIGDGDQPEPQSDQPPDQEQISDVISPAGGFPKRPTFSYQASAPDLDDNPKPGAMDAMLDDGPARELIDIRQKAVTELIPIIDKLDLPPLEKFRTIMMLIQVSDHEDLVKAAYAAAHSIPDEKDKAQALLDIVNEVNYFTHQPEPSEPEN